MNKRRLAILMSVILIYSSGISAFAAETPNMSVGFGNNMEAVLSDENSNAILPSYISLTNISTSFSSAGMLVKFGTYTHGTVSTIGVKDIAIQKKVWYGWETVATSKGCQFNNKTLMGASVLYPDAVKGETYRTKCLFYAYKKVDIEIASETCGYVCNW